MNHDNINIIKELGRSTKGGKVCVIAPGDYNCTPEELERTGLLDALGLAVVATNQVSCNTKHAREIDYVLVTRNFVNIIKSVELITTGPWPTHYGIRVRRKADPMQVTYTDLRRPPRLEEAIKCAKKNGEHGEPELISQEEGRTISGTAKLTQSPNIAGIENYHTGIGSEKEAKAMAEAYRHWSKGT